MCEDTSGSECTSTTNVIRSARSAAVTITNNYAPAPKTLPARESSSSSKQHTLPMPQGQHYDISLQRCLADAANSVTGSDKNALKLSSICYSNPDCMRNRLLDLTIHFQFYQVVHHHRVVFLNLEFKERYHNVYQRIIGMSQNRVCG
jgi:hypothetical protein